MKFENACQQLLDWINQSKGNPILLNGDQECFKSLKKYQVDEIITFEEKYKIELPNSYKYFLQKVGACEVFNHPQYGGGFRVIPLEEIEATSIEYGEDYHQYFPNFLIVIDHYSMGDPGAFDLRTNNKFAIVPHDEWLEDYLDWKKGWSTFEKWLVHCVQTEGQETL